MVVMTELNKMASRISWKSSYTPDPSHGFPPQPLSHFAVEEKMPSLLMLTATKRARNILNRNASSGQISPSGESIQKQPPRDSYLADMKAIPKPDPL